MFAVTATRKVALAFAALAASALIQPAFAPARAAGTDVVAVVNRQPITSSDVAHRVAFLRLQHQKADSKVAREQLVDEMLKRQEIARAKMSVSTDDVDKAFVRFAQGNKITPEQLTKILDQARVGVDHFKNYIAVQMSWPRLVGARFGGRGKMSNQELVTRMMENKQKPVTTEYVLKQVIFVVPAAKRNSIMNKRKAEADAARPKFPGCDQAKEFASTMLDVSVRDLGRVLAPELPEDWKPLIEKASNGTTTTRITDKGVEFLAICNQRQVSDDVAAEAVFRAEDAEKEKKSGDDPNNKKYLDELRTKAQIDYL